MASSSSPVLGLVDCPPGTTAATPNSWKIAASPSPATTATTPSAGASAGVAAAERARAAASTAGASAAVKAAARVSRTSRAWLSRFSMLIRLSVPSPRP